VRIKKLLISLFVISIGVFAPGCSLFAHPIWGSGQTTDRLGGVSTSLYAVSDSFKVNPFDTSYFNEFSHRFAESNFKKRFSLFQSPYLPTTISTNYAKPSLTSLTPGQNKINYKRAAVVGMINAGTIFFGFKQAITCWGKSDSRFHFKDDWKGDHLAQADELSHFMWGYKMSQFESALYQWMGLSQKNSQVLSITEPALLLTLVEYPIDAYNPEQGLGVSDLVFDYLGIGMAFAKKRAPWLEDFDFKISWKRNIFTANHPVFAQTYEEYDNFIYWLTYRAKLLLPQKFLCLALGYGTTHYSVEPKREFYLGIGLSVSDFVSLFGKKLREPAKFLDLFYPNLCTKL
jgi:hypothetical protein